MQLNMTVPADLDNEDRALGGEEEVFDLGEGEKEAARGGIKKALQDVVRDQDGLSEDGDEEDAASETEAEEIFDSEEERELKLQGLEGELDELYDQYRDRMSERDAKWRVKQARLKDRNQDEWHGIKEGSDGEDGVDKGYRDGMIKAPRRDGGHEDDGEESEEGGWDVVAAGKAKLGEDFDTSDDDEADDEEGDDDEAPTRTARFWERPIAKSLNPAKNLVTSLQDGKKRAQISRRAQLWFAQPVFKGIDDLAALDGYDEEEVDVDGGLGGEEESEDSEDEVDEDGDVEMEEASVASSTPEDDREDVEDFEIVPQEAEEDGPSWDVDDEDQDEIKRKTIQGMLFRTVS